MDLQFLLDNWLFLLPAAVLILKALSGTFPALKPFADFLDNLLDGLKPNPNPDPGPNPNPNPNPNPGPSPDGDPQRPIDVLKNLMEIIDFFRRERNKEGEELARATAKSFFAGDEEQLDKVKL